MVSVLLQLSEYQYLVSSSEANKLTETESTDTDKHTLTHLTGVIQRAKNINTHQYIHTQRHRDDENARLRQDPSIP